jgi:F-type H+-transporting ATPase subunit alpha
MRQVAARLRLDLAQFRELQAFAQFGTAELDAATRRQLERGQRLTEVLKQLQYEPMSLHQQVEILYAAVNGYLDDVAVAKVQPFATAFQRFMETNHPDIGKGIDDQKQITPETEDKLKAAIVEFKESVPY